MKCHRGLRLLQRTAHLHAAECVWGQAGLKLAKVGARASPNHVNSNMSDGITMAISEIATGELQGPMEAQLRWIRVLGVYRV